MHRTAVEAAMCDAFIWRSCLWPRAAELRCFARALNGVPAAAAHSSRAARPLPRGRWHIARRRTFTQRMTNAAVAAKGVLLTLFLQYQDSEDFRSLAGSTRRSYVPLIKRIEKGFGDFRLSALTDRRSRGVFMAWRDQLDLSTARRQPDYAWTVLARAVVEHEPWADAANSCERGGRRSIAVPGPIRFGQQRMRPHSSIAHRRICVYR